MRLASQLNQTSGCANGSALNLSKRNPAQIRAAIIKNITKRLLLGEPIPDIHAELQSMFAARRYKWENTVQEKENINRYAAAIENYTKWDKEENTGHKYYLDENNPDIVMNIFNEEIKVLPDFIEIEDNDKVIFTKITTGIESEPFSKNSAFEDYAYGMLGKKLFPNKQIFVQHIGLDANSFNNPHMSYGTARKFDENVQYYIEGQYEMAQEQTCSAAACANCPKNNICHFTEPPVAIAENSIHHSLEGIHLTNAQRQIVEHERGVARVNAGAGAGKTLVVALRVARLLEKGYQPEDFAILTFTKSGAEEMTARIMDYVAEKGIPLDPERITHGTFNKFCNDIIKDNIDILGYNAPPRIIPDEVRLQMIDNIIGNRLPKISVWNYSGFYQGKRNQFNQYIRNSSLVEASKLFTEIKKEGYTRENNPFNEYTYGYKNRQLQILTEKDIDIIFEAYQLYEQELKSKNMIEYDDQLKLVNLLYEKNPDLFSQLNYKHIIIDEFQDTDLQQIQLLQKMIDTLEFKSFMAVGDDSQSIFSFRHTSPEYMINFKDYFGEHYRDFPLVDNHRSNKATIDFANAINAKAHERVDKDLIPTKEEGQRPIVRGTYTQREEYDFITEEVKKRWDAGNHDIAILARTNAELIKIANYLTQADIPSIVMGQIPLQDNSRIQALLTFYDSFFSGTSQGFADYQNVLHHGAFKDMSTEAIELSAQQFAQGIAEKKRDLKTFMEFAKELDASEIDACYQDFCSKLNDCRDINELREFMDAFRTYGVDATFKREGNYEGVKLSTVHNAKGLEWDTTFLTLSGFDKTIKHSINYKNSKSYDEDIRMFFVGSTRARKELIMSGNYMITKPAAKTPYENQFLQMAYNVLNLVWSYNFAGLQYQLNKEKEEDEQKTLEMTNRQMQRLQEIMQTKQESVEKEEEILLS